MLSDIFSLSFLVSLLASTIRLATPILVPALGQIYTQRAGVLNLSTEGTMLMGAIGGFTAVCATGNLWVGVLTGILSGILFSLIMAWLSVTVRANQVIAAIGLNILAAGLAAYIYRVVFGIRTLPAQIESFSAIHIPVLSDLPVIGPIFFSHNILVYLAFLLVPVTWFVLEKTTFGLKIKAVGEHPRAADSKGVVDSSALYRQPDLTVIPRPELNELEKDADELKIGYVEVDEGGNVGLVVIGAGLGMATLDTAIHYGLRPYDFTDLGSKLSERCLRTGVKLVVQNPGIKAILFNGFGGMYSTREMAEWILASIDEFGDRKIPVVVKLRGYNPEEGWSLLEKAGIPLVKNGTTDDAVKLLKRELEEAI